MVVLTLLPFELKVSHPQHSHENDCNDIFRNQWLKKGALNHQYEWTLLSLVMAEDRKMDFL